MRKIGVGVCVLLIVASAQLSPSLTRAVASIPTCSHLVVATTTVEGADGQGYLTVVLVNESRKCELFGYPSVKFFSSHSFPLVGRDVHGVSMQFADPGARAVVLATGRVASVGVSWADNPQPRQSCVTTQWMNVVLPGAKHEYFQPSANAQLCGTTVWVTPFEAGGEPKLAGVGPPP